MVNKYLIFKSHSRTIQTYLCLRTGNDEENNNVVDNENNLYEETNDVTDKPGQELCRGPSDSSEIQEEVGDEEESEEDQL